MKKEYKNSLRAEGPLPAATSEDSHSPVSTDRSNLDLQSALLILAHLTSRGLLCGQCGYGWVDGVTQLHAHCGKCKRPSLEYAPNRKGSAFEKVLCQRLGEFVAATVTADGPSAGDASNSGGKE